MRIPNFLTQGPAPAVIGLAVFAVAVTIGILLRNTVGSLVAALVASAVVFAAVSLGYPYAMPPLRTTQPIVDSAYLGASALYGPEDQPLQLGSGLLDADGNEVQASDAAQQCWATSWPAQQKAAAELGIGDLSSYSQQIPDSVWAAGDRAVAHCMVAHGITQTYTDYQPASRLWPLRAWLAVYSVLLAAATLALGRWRLPRAVAKR